MAKPAVDLDAALDEMSDEELDKILKQLHLLENFEDYAEATLKVQTTKSTVVPFSMNGPQRTLHKIIEEHIRPNRLVRIVALKARRMGFSTYFSGRFFQSTSGLPNRYAVQITHEPDATDFLFKMVKRFYNLTPKDRRPDTLYNNTRLLEFNNQDGTGLNSAFRVGTAGKDDFGSGQLIHYLHLSEVAKWASNNIKSLLTSVTQTIPDIDDSAIVYESTAKGIGGEFYDRFWNARYRIWITGLDDAGFPIIKETINRETSKEDVHTSIFLPWFCFEDYQMPVPAGMKLTKIEARVRKQYNLSLRQMVWRRDTIANKCGGSVDTFNQEYPDNPRAAFLGTGRPVFDAFKIAAKADACKPPKNRYELMGKNWVTQDSGRLSVWVEARQDCDYIISADVAEGLEDGDFSCADVINHRTGEHVAQWHGNIDHDNILEYAEVLMELGQRYNTAMIAVERNNHGLGVVQKLYNDKYPRIYMEMIPDPPGRPRKRYGWVTSRATRPLIIDNLIHMVQEGSDGIVCKETLEEMLTFKTQDNGKMEADSGRYDDRVMSYAIAQYVRQVTELPAQRSPRHIKERKNTRRTKKPNTRGWT